MPTTTPRRSGPIRRAAALKALAEVLRGSRTPGSPGLGERLAAVPRMIAAGLRGTYPHLDISRVLFAALGVVYVLSPIDLVPELLLPLLGLGDDAFVGAWSLGALLSEAEAFLAWEAENRTRTTPSPGGDPRVVQGEVIG